MGYGIGMGVWDWDWDMGVWDWEWEGMGYGILPIPLVWVASIDLANINKLVNDRCEYVNSNQKKMLTSLLNRDFKKIILDRAVKLHDNGHATLITDPKALKAHCNDTFAL